MKKLAIISLGAVLTLAAAMQTDVNRTGQVDRSAADMQTGSSTIPGTGTDTTDQFGNIQPAEPGAATAQTAPPAQPAPPATTFEQQTEPAQPAPPVAAPQPAPAVQPAQPAQPGQATTTDPLADVQPADIGQQQAATATTTATGTASRTLPDTSANWLAMLLGGGFLGAAGLALRRR